jgi:type I restriction enzyme S subunit
MKIDSFDFLSVCDFQGGTQPPKSEFKTTLEEGYIRLLQIQDFNNDSKAVFVPKTNKLKTCESDDILLGRYGASIGRVLTGKEGAYNVAIVKLKPDARRLDKRFLFHFVSSPKFQFFIQNTSERAAQAGFNKKDFENFQIPLPPIAQQKRIAAILDKADAVRRKRREAIRLTEELLRSTFLEMFGDPVTNSKKWKVVDFDQIRNGDIRNGLSPSSRGKFQSQVLTLAAITQNKFNISEKKPGFFDKEPTPEKTLNPKIFLICRGNGNLNLVGRGKFPDILTEDIFFPDTMIGVPVDQTQINPDFLEFLWNTRFIRDQVESQARTTNGTYKINQDVVRNLKILLPSRESQEKFGKIAKTMKKTAAFSFLEESASLFGSLLQRAFTGNL